jgi:hypothetical protein
MGLHEWLRLLKNAIEILKLVFVCNGNIEQYIAKHVAICPIQIEKQQK